MDVARREIEHLNTVATEGEGDIRIYQHNPLESGYDIIQFRGIRFQKLPACGDVEKEILNKEIAAYGTRARFLSCHPACRDRQMGSNIIVGLTRAQFHLCHSGYRRQGLTTEAS